MKLRLKQNRGVVDFRPDTDKSVTDVLALVVGRKALFGENPRQVFANMNLRNKASLLEFWIMSGYIVGTPDSWKLSPSVIQKIQSNFGVQTALPALGTQASLYTLVSRFRKYLKDTPKHKTPPNGSTAAQFRVLCKKFNSRDIENLMPEFFSNRSWPVYSVEQFGKFVQSKLGKSPL